MFLSSIAWFRELSRDYSKFFVDSFFMILQGHLHFFTPICWRTNSFQNKQVFVGETFSIRDSPRISICLQHAQIIYKPAIAREIRRANLSPSKPVIYNFRAFVGSHSGLEIRIQNCCSFVVQQVVEFVVTPATISWSQKCTLTFTKSR